MSSHRSFPAPGVARHLLPAALSAAALVAALPSSAVAQTVLRACYVPNSGTVYRVGAPNTAPNCLQPSHVAFQWTDGADAFAALEQAVKKTDAAAGDVTGVFANLTVARLLGRALATTPPTEGQVLAWNATTNQWEPRAVGGGGGGGVTAHGQLTGLTADDHPQYLLTQGVRNSVNGFAVTGTEGQGTIPATGPGSRLMWYAGKSAFRVGIATANTWDDAQIGLRSFAAGVGSIASGPAAIAMGVDPKASGDESVAIGSLAVATQKYATALGYSSEATGVQSMAIGMGAEASALNAHALGYNAQATGADASAFGTSARASGQASVALGTALASGTEAIALGGIASATRSISLGLRSSAKDAGSFVLADGGSEFVFSGAANQFTTRFSGGYRLYSNLAQTTGCFIAAGGGAWTCTSDRNTKTALADVDGESLLGKLRTLPITTWEYRTERGARHLGPMAQDFRAAFGLGSDEKAIGVLDASGVALAAAQALEARTRALQAENAQLRQHADALTERLAHMEGAIAALEAQLQQRH